MSDHFQSLLDDWLDDTLNSADEEQLRLLLSENPEYMRRFAQANMRNQLLGEVARADSVSAHVTERTLKSTRKAPITITRRLAIILVSAAAIFVCVLPFLEFANNGVTVEVIANNNAVAIGAPSPLAAGESAKVDRIRLESGSLELLLASNVRIELVAPLEAVFENDMRLKLLAGRISADVGKEGIGFTVVTDAGNVVDLGTRFGVEADRNGESRVAVFSGAVEFHPNAGNAAIDFVTLTEGEALRFSARAGLRRWQQVALEINRAGLSGANSSPIVESVADNLGEGDLRPFYGVIAGGMKPGALAFTDKPNPVWKAIPGEKFPATLTNSDLIRTYYRFHNKKNYKLTLTLNKPAEVFVLLVTPNTPPKWLIDGFERTNNQVRVGPWHTAIARHPATIVEPDGNYLHFEVWKCEAGPGELSLGPPRDSKIPGVQALMYGLAVKELNPTP